MARFEQKRGGRLKVCWSRILVLSLCGAIPSLTAPFVPPQVNTIFKPMEIRDINFHLLFVVLQRHRVGAYAYINSGRWQCTAL